MAVAPEAIHLVESVDDVARAARLRRAGRAARADDAVAPRLGRRARRDRATRFPDMWRPGRSDLCFATTNRQSALTAIAARCDAVVVIGSANSSNTRALEKLARESGCAARLPRQRRRRAARRPVGHRRRHRRRVGARGARRRGDRPPRARARRRGGRDHRPRRSTSRRRRELRELLAAVDAVATCHLGGSVADGRGSTTATLAASEVLAEALA